MEKIRIHELVDFRRILTDKSRRNFAYKLKTRKAKDKLPDEEDKNGGDYWKTSTSCIYNVVKYNEYERYENKISELTDKMEVAEDNRVKSMHERNISILNNFKDFQIDDIRPTNIFKFEKVQKNHKIFSLDDYPLYVDPSLLFVYEKNGKTELGAIWLVAKLNGFKKNELGMFCELLHKFLTTNYSDNYQVSDNLCIAVDTFNAQKVSYRELLEGHVPFLLQETIREIRNS